MVTTDDHGKIRFLNFDGTTRKIATVNSSPEHFFLPVDFKGDGIIRFLLCDKHRLYCYDLEGKVIFSLTLDTSIDQAPLLINLGDEKIIGLNSVAEKRTILVRKDGSIIHTFLPGKINNPLIGSLDSNFSILNLIGSGEDGFLSNYQIVLK